MGKQYNILLILTDQQNIGTIGAYGATMCKTPHIDSLAENGLKFTSAFTPTSICSPARASLITGVYPHRHGVLMNDGVLNTHGVILAAYRDLVSDPGVFLVNQYLAESGYQCGYAGKWHVDRYRKPTEVGFKGKDFLGYAHPGACLWDGFRWKACPHNKPNYYELYLRERGLKTPRIAHALYSGNPAQEAEMCALLDAPEESSIPYFVAEEAISLIREFSTSDHPFFIWANFWGPHWPGIVPEPYYSMYSPDSIEPAQSYLKEDFSAKPEVQKLAEKRWNLSANGWRTWQEMIARNWGYCTQIDAMVGWMVAELDGLGLLENTVVIYTTDHGDMFGAHRLIDKGPFMYDETYHIPMIISHPDGPKGEICDEFVYLHDLTPTFCDIAGSPVPDIFDGQSIMSLLRGERLENERDAIYCTMEGLNLPFSQRMVRTRSHKFIFNASSIGELYDLRSDRHELENILGRPEAAAVQKELIARMKQFMNSLKDPLGRWFNEISDVY
jgi:arylsulfatase A-like enzyme